MLTEIKNKILVVDDSDLERELLSFTLPELRGLVLHARVYDPSLWDPTDEEAED